MSSFYSLSSHYKALEAKGKERRLQGFMRGGEEKNLMWKELL
jgi:hypothetical protein